MRTGPLVCAILLTILIPSAARSETIRRNVLIFITEDQSFHLGCLGTKGLETPHLDRFAGGGTNFTRAFALSPVCSPSKMSLLTGTFPHTNSAIRNVPNYGVAFPLPKDRDPSVTKLGGVHEDLPTLIEILREKEVYTAVSSKSHVQPVRKFPFDRGFPNPSNPKIARRIVSQVVDESKAADQPFFLWLNIASPHLPFPALLKANRRWDREGGLVGDGGATGVDPNEIEIPNCYPDTPAVRQDIADYYANIEVIDGIFEEAVRTLEEKGQRENTLIIFTSDHGIGLHRAKQSIYGAGLHIPFLVQSPDQNAVQVIEAPVSHLDVAPTVLDYLEIEKPATMHGKSLRPILRGEVDSFADRPVMLTACHRYYSARAVTDGSFYYIRNLTQPKGGSLKRPQSVLNQDQYQGGPPWFNRTYAATVEARGTKGHQLLRQIVEGGLPGEELYDLDSDPWMVKNLIDQYRDSELISNFRKEMAAWRKLTGDRPENLKRRTKP